MNEPFFTGVCYLMGVEMPEGATEPEIRTGFAGYGDNDCILIYQINGTVGTIFLDEKELAGYRWSIIGPPFSVTEEVARGLVKCLTPGFKLDFYQNYKYGLPQPAGVTCGTALESLYSAYKIMDLKEGDNQYLLRGDKI
jgi:hypothetical protein